MESSFTELCTPAKLYFIVAVFISILMLLNKANIITVLLKLVFAFLWTSVLSWLCKKGYKAISWFLVLLPFILMIFAKPNTYESELLESMANKKR